MGYAARLIPILVVWPVLVAETVEHPLVPLVLRLGLLGTLTQRDGVFHLVLQVAANGCQFGLGLLISRLCHLSLTPWKTIPTFGIRQNSPLPALRSSQYSTHDNVYLGA